MLLLDIARGAYVRSPPFLRRSLSPLVAMVPTSLKYGSSYDRWRERIVRAREDRAFAARELTASLRRLLVKAHEGSPFYRERLAKAFGPSKALETVECADIGRLPILTKSDLVAAGETALAIPKDKLDAATTSGSSGEFPFQFYLDRDRSVREIAFVHDVWSRAGFAPSDARCVLRGFRLDAPGQSNHEWEPALREMRLSVFPMREADVAEYFDLIDERQIRYLHGYPSAIELMCRIALRSGRRPRLPLKGIFPISEPVFAHQRKVFAPVFGDTPVVPFYGLSEKALFAAEVEGEEDVYEFDPLYGLAELVDDHGDPVVEVGAEGRVIGTGFLSTGMPFIRYDTEDRATLVQRPSLANGWRMQVRSILPRRKPDFLIDREGHRVVATDFTPEDLTEMAGIAEFQLYQDTAGLCTLRYIPSAEGTRADAERLIAYLTERADGRLAFDHEVVDSLVTGRAGKRAFVDQHLDLTKY